MSALLSADDLNDFITPGVACINPVEIKKAQSSANNESREIRTDGDVVYEVTKEGENTSATALSAAQISLADCLACSGCITSAESVLVSLQSHTKLMEELRAKSENKVFVVSISYQTRASLAAAFDLSIPVVDSKLKSLLQDTLGIKHIVGLGLGREIALRYSMEEIIQSLGNNSGKPATPLMCSSCPGWVCYVEKTHPNIIPYLSKVKSPQQITGTILKEELASLYGIDGKDVYHASIMPCFDKKLEASRPEYNNEVDIVITTKELIQLLIDESLPDFPSIPFTVPENLTTLYEEMCGGLKLFHRSFAVPSDNFFTASGGFLMHSLAALQALNPGSSVSFKEGRNSDIGEYVLYSANGEVIVKAGYVYGFRNIQNLVRKFKTKKTSRERVRARNGTGTGTSGSSTAIGNPAEFQFLEVMACPGGCLNGGGQIGAPETFSSQSWKALVEEKYNQIQRYVSESETTSLLSDITSKINEQHLVLAQYSAVETSFADANAALGAKW